MSTAALIPQFQLCGPSKYDDQEAAQAAARNKRPARGGRWKAKKCVVHGGHWHVYLERQDRARRDRKHGRLYA